MKTNRECIKTSVNWKPSSPITTDDTVIGSHQTLMTSKWSSGTGYWLMVSGFFIHNQICGLLPEYQLAACHPQSQKREVGTFMLWPHARACWMNVKEGGFDWWMVWKWVSWGVHQQLSMSAHAPIPHVWGTVLCVSKPFFLFLIKQYTFTLIFSLKNRTRSQNALKGALY